MRTRCLGYKLYPYIYYGYEEALENTQEPSSYLKLNSLCSKAHCAIDDR